jgi:hypothetical protein
VFLLGVFVSPRVRVTGPIRRFAAGLVTSASLIAFESLSIKFYALLKEEEQTTILQRRAH